MQSIKNGALSLMERTVAAMAVLSAVVTGTAAQQSQTMNGPPQQVIPQVGETGAPPPQTQVGSPATTSGGAPSPAAGAGTSAAGSSAITGGNAAGG